MLCISEIFECEKVRFFKINFHVCLTVDLDPVHWEDHFKHIKPYHYPGGCQDLTVGQKRRGWPYGSPSGRCTTYPEHTSPSVSAKFYIAVVQSIFLYESETWWVLGKAVLVWLEGFCIRPAYKMAKKHVPRWGPVDIGLPYKPGHKQHRGISNTH